MLTCAQMLVLAQVSRLQIKWVHVLLHFCHAQTFVVLTKTLSTGNRHAWMISVMLGGRKRACL